MAERKGLRHLLWIVPLLLILGIGGWGFNQGWFDDLLGDDDVVAETPAPAPVTEICDYKPEMAKIWEHRGWPAAHRPGLEAEIDADPRDTTTIVAIKGRRLGSDRTRFWSERKHRGGDAANMYAYNRDMFKDGTAEVIIYEVDGFTYVAYFEDDCCLKAIYRLKAPPAAASVTTVRRNNPEPEPETPAHTFRVGDAPQGCGICED